MKNALLVLVLLFLTCLGYSQNYGSVSDIDGNEYKTITIGAIDTFIISNLNPPYVMYDYVCVDSITIMIEDLKTTHFSNGDSIPQHLTENYFKDITYSIGVDKKNQKHFLYCYYAVIDQRGICPKGWHPPTLMEWETIYKHMDKKVFLTDLDYQMHRSHGGEHNLTYSLYMFWAANTSTRMVQKAVSMDMREITDIDFNSNAGLSCRCIKD